MKRVYLAARAGRRLEMLAYAEELAALGFDVTSSWIHAEAPEETMSAHARGQLAFRCLSDLTLADGLIAFTEPSDSTWARGGRHVELGYALGIGDFRAIVVGHRENVFCCLEEVEYFETWEACKAKLGAPVAPPPLETTNPFDVVRGCSKHAPPDVFCGDCAEILSHMNEERPELEAFDDESLEAVD